MKLYQDATVTDLPQNPNSIVNKQYVDNIILSGSAVTPVFFTDVSPTSSGIVGNKQYVAGTTPANAVITQADSDTNDVTISLVAEGPNVFYSPTLTLTGSPSLPGEPITVPLVEDANDKRFFSGSVALNLTSSTTEVTVTSSSGNTATVTINQAAAGPEIVSLQIDSLPFGVNSGLQQTEVKQGDIVTVSGTVPNSATFVEIIPGGATDTSSTLTLNGVDSGGAGLKSFTGTFVTGSGSGPQSITARARNSLGTFGSNTTSSNNVSLNQTYPIIGAFSITYPGGQIALKNSEPATVNATVTQFDQILYSTTSQLAVKRSTVYNASKTVQRTGGDYNVSVDNYTITAIKNSNDALTESSTVVNIANIAPQISITIDGSPARLRSSQSGNPYIVRINSNQIMNTAPTSLDASSGTFIGSWTSNSNDYIRTIEITDSDPKGNQLFSNLNITSISNIPVTSIFSGSAYITGGFTPRNVVYDPFQQAGDIGTVVSDITKVVAEYTGSDTLAFFPDLLFHINGFSVADRINDDSNAIYDPNNRYLWISDSGVAGANVTGTLTLTVEEVE